MRWLTELDVTLVSQALTSDEVKPRKGFTMNNETNTIREQQYAERDRLEAEFEEKYPNGFDRDSDMIEAMKQSGLYCGTCGHGKGCEHGVPASRY